MKIKDMDLEQLNGEWTGFFVYGNGYPATYREKKNDFTIVVNGADGMIKGECTDVFVRKYFTSPATIDGSFENGAVTFIKRYPSLLTIDENEKVTVFPDRPSHEVLYTGHVYKKLFSRKIYFKGRWDISGSFLDEDKNARYYTFGGTWEMEKS